ncbi:MAG: SgcJ/EcaC family oxidoreductase [Candidatus Melainabacteria bacterium]|jgi:uncharacterized protein (TIGR02246 family)|nr:SgcJ/EcaC family oxidoreductase [Candidatus Melainabacteria bacterium]
MLSSSHKRHVTGCPQALSSGYYFRLPASAELRRIITSNFGKDEEAMNQSKRNLFILSALSAALTANFFYMAPQAACAKKSGKSKKTTVETKTVTQGDAESAIKNQLSSLAAAAMKADAEQMASFFALDGSYVNEDGLRVVGRPSLKEHFAKHVSPEMNGALKLEPHQIRLIGNDTAWIEGSTTRQIANQKSTDARFTMLLTNQNGTWVIQSATETTVTPKGSAAKLSDLDWLVGDWVAERGTEKVRMTAEKVGNGNFLHLKYLIAKAGETPKIDTQVIGWDPNRDQIISWHFDSSGGFGYGRWRKQDNKWIINAEGVEQSGWNSTATNVISSVDKNSFQWQSMRRTVDGLTFADTEPLTVKRVSQ